MVSLKKQVGSVVVVGTVAMEEKVVGSVAVAKDSPTHSAVH